MPSAKTSSDSVNRINWEILTTLDKGFSLAFITRNLALGFRAYELKRVMPYGYVGMVPRAEINFRGQEEFLAIHR